MKDRIKQIMDGQHMTQQEFSDFLNIAPATLSSILRERTRPTLSIVDAIVSRFPDISTDWLLFGKGPMKKSAEAQNDAVETPDRTSDSELVLDFPEVDSSFQRPSTPPQPSSSADLFSQQRNVAQQEQLTMVKNIDKRQRRITEIRIFYDDQTWETFVPKE
jgi:transcriptional regulator with XRE-family HTH domain